MVIRMEQVKRVKSVFEITMRLHDKIDIIYESVVDSDGDSLSLVDGLIADLRVLKSNLIKDK